MYSDKIEKKRREYDSNQNLVFSPPGLSAVRTGKTENQIGSFISSRFSVLTITLHFTLCTINGKEGHRIVS
ncbi:MAG: hypothetical protein DWQ00_00335 [Candidatus Scalindua sp.]|nr:MAG: hypothetical protein DWQ00_00335 [Candidatus Scalindua sp.]